MADVSTSGFGRCVDGASVPGLQAGGEVIVRTGPMTSSV